MTRRRLQLAPECAGHEGGQPRNCHLLLFAAVRLWPSPFRRLRAFPEKIDSGDSNFLANQIQASCWKEASTDAETLF